MNTRTRERPLGKRTLKVADDVKVRVAFFTDTHCPKAFVRSALWSADTWPADDDDIPSPAEVSLAHQRDPSLTLADVERTQRESLLHGLD